jgi:hypothetical protein
MYTQRECWAQRRDREEFVRCLHLLKKMHWWYRNRWEREKTVPRSAEGRRGAG